MVAAVPDPADPHRAAHRAASARSSGFPALRLCGSVPGADHADGRGRDHDPPERATSSPTAARDSGASTRAAPPARPCSSARRSPRATPPTTATAWWSSAILFLVVAWHIRGKPGRAWAAIRQSEVTAVAAGVNTTLYKLWASPCRRVVTGVAGALLAASPGGRHHQPVPGAGVDPPAGRGADGRRVQHLGRGRRRLLASALPAAARPEARASRPSSSSCSSASA